MTSSEPSASAKHEPVDRQAGGVSTVPGHLAAAARALAGAPASADDAALLALLARAIVPALGDVVALYAADGSGRARLIGAAPGDAPSVRRSGTDAGQTPELVAPLDGDAPGGDLLVIRAADPARRYGDADRAAVEVLAALIGARRAASRQAVREAALRQQLETLSLAGRELSHALNNDLTMPVGVIELLTDRTTFSPDLQEMLQAAAKDLAALEQHVRAFHDLMRAQTGGAAVE